MSLSGPRALREATALFQRGDAAGAQRLALQSIKSDPQFTAGWLFLSKLAIAANQGEAALKLVSSAAKIEPNNLRVQAYQAYVFAMSLHFDEALASLPDIESKAGTDAFVWSDIGNAYHVCGELARAKQAFERALTLDPDNPSFAYNLATSCKFAGEFERAEQLADQVIAKTPEDWGVYEFRSGLRMQTEDRNHIAELTALLDKGIDDSRGDVRVAYALAKEHEDLDDLPSAFANYKRAADTRRRSMNYDVHGDVSALSALIEAYTPEFLAQQDGAEDARPIFIVGLPRTGTTLLDRIISGHSDVMSAGELQDFGNAVIQAVVKAAPGVKHDKLSMIRAATKVDHAAMGADYLSRTQARTQAAVHFVDKLPINYLYLGSIARALPNASLIHMDRHPIDTAYAMYKTLFSDAYPFSYDLSDLGHYYVAHRKLMDHWHQHMGDRLLRICYEDLVKDQETEARRVIAHVGLEWQDQCLDFQINEQATNTASAVQVRQKVYSTSVGKWRQLEPQLAPFRRIVEEAGFALPD